MACSAGGDGMRLNGLHYHFHFFSGDGGLREVEMRISNRRDGSNVSKGELVMMIDIWNITWVHDVVLSNCTPSFGGRNLSFDSEFQLKIPGPLIMKLAEHGYSIFFAEYFLTINTN